MDFKEINVPKTEEKKQLFQKKQKQGILSYLPSAILTIILIAMSSLGALIQFKFSFNEIVWSTLAISMALRLITTFLSKYVGSNLYYNKNLNSKEVTKIKEDFEKESADIDKNAIANYCDKINIDSKILAYKKKKYKRIIRIKNLKDKLEHKNKLDCRKRRSKRIERLSNKLSRLESKVDEEYIKDNIAYFKVKYKKVKSSYFLSSNEEQSDKYVTYSIQFSKENTKGIAKSLPLTALLIFFGALISYEAYFGNINVISILYDTAIMLFNFIAGWYIVGREIISKTISAYVNRIIFIAKFKASAKSTTCTNQNLGQVIKQTSTDLKTANNVFDATEFKPVKNESVNQVSASI